MINDSDKFELLIAHAIPDVVVNILTLFGVTAVLLTLNWQLTLLASSRQIPLVILSLRTYAKFVRPAFSVRQHELGELNAIINDNLSGITRSEPLRSAIPELDRIRNRIDRYRDSLLYALKMMAIFQPFIEFTSALGTIVVIYFGGRLILQQTLPVADLVAFFLYLDLFYQPLRNLSNAWEQLQEALRQRRPCGRTVDRTNRNGRAPPQLPCLGGRKAQIFG